MVVEEFFKMINLEINNKLKKNEDRDITWIQNLIKENLNYQIFILKFFFNNLRLFVSSSFFHIFYLNIKNILILL